MEDNRAARLVLMAEAFMAILDREAAEREADPDKAQMLEPLTFGQVVAMAFDQVECGGAEISPLTDEIVIRVGLKPRERDQLVSAGLRRSQIQGTVQQMLGRLIVEIKQNMKLQRAPEIQKNAGGLGMITRPAGMLDPGHRQGAHVMTSRLGGGDE